MTDPDLDEAELARITRWHKLERDVNSQHWCDVDTLLAVNAKLSQDVEDMHGEVDREVFRVETEHEKRIEDFSSECDSLQRRLDEAEAELDKLRSIVNEAGDKSLPVERRRLLVNQLLSRLS